MTKEGAGLHRQVVRPRAVSPTPKAQRVALVEPPHGPLRALLVEQGPWEETWPQAFSSGIVKVLVFSFDS